MVYEKTGNKKVDRIYELIEEEAFVTAGFHRKQAVLLDELTRNKKSHIPVNTGGSDIANRGFRVL